MQRTRAALLAAATLTLAAPPCRAEGRPADGGAPPRLALAVGCGSGSMAVGDSKHSQLVPTLSARVGLDRRSRFVLAGEWQPAHVASPIADEAFAAGNLLAGVAFGSRLRIRLLAGAQFRRWSGSQITETSDTGPVLGADLSYDLRVSDRLTLTPELVWRGSVVEVEGSVGSSFAGAQLAFGWRR